MLRRQIPLALPLSLYLSSAFIGALIAYDPAKSGYVLSFIVISVVLYCTVVFVQGQRDLLLWFVLLFIVLSAVLVVYFAIQHDWTESPLSNPLINRIGIRLRQALEPLPVQAPHPNNLAGILELALPLCFALAVHWVYTRQHRRATAALVIAFVLAIGILLSDSRGAWLALGTAAILALAWKGLQSFQRTSPSWKPFRSALGLVLVLCIALLALAALIVRFIGISEAANGFSTEIPRLSLYRQVLSLLRDYLFTGSGLGTFPMVYSTYALLGNVFILPHAHNILLQIWVEQGLLGVMAFVWLVVAFYVYVWRRREQLGWLARGGLIATTVMLLHGLVDAALWYSDWTRVLLFFPMALTVAGLGTVPVRVDHARIAVLTAVFGLVCIVIVGSPVAALWQANLGSLAQTQVELGQYEFPERLVEYTRRDADLTRAENYFRQALVLDRSNVTANQRLALIALARGNYAEALTRAETAYGQNANDAVTWQLLGDAYLASGQLDQAYVYWSKVDDAPSRLYEEMNVRYVPQRDRMRAEWTKTLADRIRVHSSAQ